MPIIPSAPFNLDNFTNATNIFLVADASNDLVLGYLPIMILVCTFLITFTALVGRSNEKDAFIVASFMTTIISVLMMTPLEWITLSVFWFPLALLMISIGFKMFTKD